MSLWKIGAGELPEDTIAFKNKISSQDAQLAAQESRLLKQSDQLQQLQQTLNETLSKLSHETQKNLTLESNLARCNNDLAQKKTSLHNIQSSLATANTKLKEKEVETRDLQATLESVSDNSNSTQTRVRTIEQERDQALRRIQALELEVRQLNSTAVASQTPPTKRNRSSSLSNFRISSLESQLEGLQTTVSEKEAHLQELQARMSQAQSGQAKAENEKVALERRLQKEVEDLKAALEDRDYELSFLRGQNGGAEREEELLRRIDEDAEKIASLELLLRSEDPRKLRAELDAVREKLRLQCLQVEHTEALNIELVSEKEGALDGLETAKTRIQTLEATMAKAASNSAPTETVTSTVQNLLEAIERLRGERDSLRRQVEFLEPEARFAMEALETELASKAGPSHPSPASSSTQDRKRLHRLSRMALASTVIISHLNSELVSTEARLDAVTFRSQALNDIVSEKSNELESSPLDLMDLQSQSTSTHQSLQGKSLEPEELASRLQEVEETNERLNAQVTELEAALNEVETARSSLSLRVVHLERDVSTAQTELAEAESRYSSLQFHQLSEMTSNEATQALKQQIHDLEMRVMRRTEQIGLHQHDIGRLETNLKVAEERVSEMTVELEMLTAQKEAMVEDCADARDARDAALERIEKLEEELEDLEARSAQDVAGLTTMVQIIAESVTQSRSLQSSRQRILGQLEETKNDRDAAQHAARAAADELQSLQQQVFSLEEESKQATVALAVAHTDFNSRLASAVPQGAIQDLEAHIRDLQSRLDAEIAQSKSLTTQLDALRQEALSLSTTQEQDRALKETAQLAEIASLKAELAQASQALETAQASIHDLQQQQEAEQTAELTRLRQEWSDRVSALEQKLASEEESARRLEETLEGMTASQAVTERQLEDKDSQYAARIEELNATTSSLQSQLDSVSQELSQAHEELTQLTEQLQEEADVRKIEGDAHQIKFLSAKERADAAEQHLSQLEDALVTSQAQVRELEGKDLAQQQEITGLAAEIQRLKSSSRYHEAKLKESSDAIVDLTSQLAESRSAYEGLSEQRSRLEGTLSLETAHYRRETAKLQQQLEALQSRPDLDQAVRDLEERNNEMEELLRQKCAEIEENDDRVLERMKENKKLAAKVESLSRKVNNLQAKLAAAKATATGSAEASPPLPPLPKQSERERATTMNGRAATSPTLPNTASSTTYIPSSRSISGGPSSLPRPKTPERRVTTSRRSGSPEKMPFPRQDPLPTASALGKKRPAPEDFESIPPQAFNADSRPSEPADNLTPRVRKVLTSIQSGFTPVRNQNRPIISLPSPKRDRDSLARPRVTENAPVVFTAPGHTGDQPTKRSWLGKIRGASQVTPSHKSASRPAFTMTN